MRLCVHVQLMNSVQQPRRLQTQRKARLPFVSPLEALAETCPGGTQEDAPFQARLRYNCPGREKPARISRGYHARLRKGSFVGSATGWRVLRGGDVRDRASRGCGVVYQKAGRKGSGKSAGCDSFAALPRPKTSSSSRAGDVSCLPPLFYVLLLSFFWKKQATRINISISLFGIIEGSISTHLPAKALETVSISRMAQSLISAFPRFSKTFRKM